MNNFILFRIQRLLKAPLDQLKFPMQEAESQQKEKEDTYGKAATETSASKVIIQT